MDAVTLRGTAECGLTSAGAEEVVEPYRKIQDLKKTICSLADRVEKQAKCNKQQNRQLVRLKTERMGSEVELKKLQKKVAYHESETSESVAWRKSLFDLVDECVEAVERIRRTPSVSPCCDKFRRLLCEETQAKLEAQTRVRFLQQELRSLKKMAGQLKALVTSAVGVESTKFQLVEKADLKKLSSQFVELKSQCEQLRSLQKDCANGFAEQSEELVKQVDQLKHRLEILDDEESCRKAVKQSDELQSPLEKVLT